VSRRRKFHSSGGRFLSSIPGHPRWGLAPIEMASQGKTPGEICRQLKDPRRNGGRSLELLHEHAANDDLVAWGWHPGAGREPAPGTQELFGRLVQAWIDIGAECPSATTPMCVSSTFLTGSLDRRFAKARPNPSAWNQFDLHSAYCGAAFNNQMFQSVRCKPQCSNIGGISMPMNMFF
jgi:hypothetical protein